MTQNRIIKYIRRTWVGIRISVSVLSFLALVVRVQLLQQFNVLPMWGWDTSVYFQSFTGTWDLHV